MTITAIVMMTDCDDSGDSDDDDNVDNNGINEDKHTNFMCSWNIGELTIESPIVLSGDCHDQRSLWPDDPT